MYLVLKCHTRSTAQLTQFPLVKSKSLKVAQTNENTCTLPYK
jgi:hypothetical protein